MAHRRDKNRRVFNVPVNIGHEKDAVFVHVPTQRGDIRLVFTSVDELLGFTVRLMDEAEKVWPDNQWVKEYQR